MSVHLNLVKMLLKRLTDDNQAVVSKSDFVKLLGREAWAEVQETKQQLDEAATISLEDHFTPASIDYHKETERLIASTRMTEARQNLKPDAKAKLLKQYASKSERLEEVFEERVPECDRAKFIYNIADEPAEYDDRWEWLEWKVPLISRQFITDLSGNMNSAQRNVVQMYLYKYH